MEIVVASGNKGKVAEIAAALAGLPVTVLPLSDFGPIVEPEETGITFEENARIKAAYYSRITGKPCLADDSGLEVDALQGAPGVFSARFAGSGATDSLNNRKLLAEMVEIPDEKRTARFRCVLFFSHPKGNELTAEGTCEGTILHEPHGSGGFGYDPLFYMSAFGKTLAQMTLVEKNQVSHRGQALRKMADKLARYFHEDRCD